MIPMSDVIKATGVQQKMTLPKEKARTLLVELMHEGFDTFCSEVDKNGNLTVIWPASLETGKQLKSNTEQTDSELKSNGDNL